MPGPRIYTKSWERLKVAAKEMDERTREAEESRHKPAAAAEKPKQHLKVPRPFVIATAVLAVLTILTGSLWIDSQARLMTAARDVTDFKTRLDLLQEKMAKLEDERQRLADENGTLSLQYEQRATELAQLEQELETLRSRKENGKSKPKQPGAGTETPSAKAPGAPKAVQDPAPPVPPHQEKGNTQQLQGSEQRGVKAYTID